MSGPGLVFTTVLPANTGEEPAFAIALDHDQRRRSRLRLIAAGRDIGVLLPRGTRLSHGDRLRAEDGTVARVQAAPEHVSVVETADPHLLARGAYHLGNRHVALQITAGRLVYPHDHVLDGLCRELGLAVSVQLLPFEPEAGGYAGEHGHGSAHALAPGGPAPTGIGGHRHR